jgi:hypothetical protein
MPPQISNSEGAAAHEEHGYSMNANVVEPTGPAEAVSPGPEAGQPTPSEAPSTFGPNLPLEAPGQTAETAPTLDTPAAEAVRIPVMAPSDEAAPVSPAGAEEQAGAAEVSPMPTPMQAEAPHAEKPAGINPEQREQLNNIIELAAKLSEEAEKLRGSLDSQSAEPDTPELAQAA